MYFKPRIFISSTMGDKLQLRTDIKNIFESAGAEVVLYEKDLTPSVNPNTYRSDILQTEFAIFIIDQRYGAKTNTGLSGTEEEFDIVSFNKKPCHVYLKKIKKTDEAKQFEDKIRSKGISFYYYKDTKDLLNKLRLTCFTIARDIAYYQIDNQKINQTLVRKLALKNDIEAGKIYCQIMDELFEISNKTPFHLNNSNLLIQAMDTWASYVLASTKSILIDRKADELLRDLCNNILIFNGRMATESTSSPQSMTLNILNETLYLSFNQWIYPIDSQWYDNQLAIIINAYNNYKNYLANMAMEVELLIT